MFKLMGRIQNWVLAVAGIATAGLFGISVTDIKGCIEGRPDSAISAELRIEIDRKLKVSDLLMPGSTSRIQDWDAAIQQYAGSIYKAKAQGLDVSDHEVGQAIMGQFKTKDAYRQFAQQAHERFNVKTYEIEELFRDQILMAKSRNLPLLTAYITKNEVKEEFHRSEDKLTYDRVLVDIHSVKLEQELTDEEKRSFFQEKSVEEAYQVDPMVKIDYLFVKPEDMTIAALTDESKKAFYNENRDRYASTEFPGEAKPYFEVEEEVGKALEKQERDNKAKALLSELDDALLSDAEGKLDFSAALMAAQAKNPEFKKVQYGTSAAFAQKDYRVEPLGYVFSLGSRLFGENPRSYGGALEAGNGFYLYKIVENIEGRPETYEEAEAKVIEALTMKKKEDAAEKLATEWKSKLVASTDWGTLTLPEGVSYTREDVTGVFSAEAMQAISLEDGAVSEPFEANQAFAMVKMVKRTPADTKGLEAREEQLKEGLLRQKAQSIQIAQFTQAQPTKLE